MESKSNRVVKLQHVIEEKRTASRQLRHFPTEAEALLWSHLRNSALGIKFRRQQVIRGFIVDFYCDAAKLIVEADGGVHEENPEKDKERDAIFSGMNLTVLHFTNTEILMKTTWVLDAIRAAI